MSNPDAAPVFARISGPWRCANCGWNLRFSYDGKIMACENGVEPVCALFNVTFKVPTVELVPADK